RRFQVAPGLPMQEVAHPPGEMRSVAGNADQALTAFVGLGPDSSAYPAAMHDAMRDAAQRHVGAVSKWRSLRQPLEPRCNPAAMLLRKRLGFFQTAARRHGQDDLAGGRLDAQRVAPRLSMPA